MKYSGGTFSVHKLTICDEQFTIVGHICTTNGRIPGVDRIAAIRNWGPCRNISELRTFLGTVSLLCMFIKNFTLRVHHLNKLKHKDVLFEFGPQQIATQEDLKNAALTCPALKPIDYKSDLPVILSVNTSYIAVRFYLCQQDPTAPQRRTYSRFDSITLNDREVRFSQPKLEIYSLYHALRKFRLYLLGVRNLIVKTDM